MAQVPIFTPSDGRPMRVAVFFSGEAIPFEAMLKDPQHGDAYEVVLGITDNPESLGVDKFLRASLPVAHFTLEFPKRDAKAAEPMYGKVLEELGKHGPDVIALCGFNKIVTYPIIGKGGRPGEYTGRVFNVHHADLSLVKSPGAEGTTCRVSDMEAEQAYVLVKERGWKRRFSGYHPVHNAILAGEKVLRSTVHIATESINDGPIVVRSFELDVPSHLRSYAQCKPDGNFPGWAEALEERLEACCDGSAYRMAMHMTARGELAIDGNTLYRKGEALPYGGVLLNG